MAPRFSDLLGSSDPAATTTPDAADASVADAVQRGHEDVAAAPLADDSGEARVSGGEHDRGRHDAPAATESERSPNPFASLAAEQAERLDTQDTTNERLRSMGLEALAPVDDDLLPRD